MWKGISHTICSIRNSQTVTFFFLNYLSSVTYNLPARVNPSHCHRVLIGWKRVMSSSFARFIKASPVCVNHLCAFSIFKNRYWFKLWYRTGIIVGELTFHLSSPNHSRFTILKLWLLWCFSAAVWLFQATPRRLCVQPSFPCAATPLVLKGH